LGIKDAMTVLIWKNMGCYDNSKVHECGFLWQSQMQVIMDWLCVWLKCLEWTKFVWMHMVVLYLSTWVKLILNKW
jgi:hypothetical protein